MNNRQSIHSFYTEYLSEFYRTYPDCTDALIMKIEHTLCKHALAIFARMDMPADECAKVLQEIRFRTDSDAPRMIWSPKSIENDLRTYKEEIPELVSGFSAVFDYDRLHHTQYVLALAESVKKMDLVFASVKDVDKRTQTFIHTIIDINYQSMLETHELLLAAPSPAADRSAQLHADYTQALSAFWRIYPDYSPKLVQTTDRQVFCNTAMWIWGMLGTMDAAACTQAVDAIYFWDGGYTPTKKESVTRYFSTLKDTQNQCIPDYTKHIMSTLLKYDRYYDTAFSRMFADCFRRITHIFIAYAECCSVESLAPVVKCVRQHYTYLLYGCNHNKIKTETRKPTLQVTGETTAKLDRMIGLGRVKEKIAELQSYIAMELRCKEMGLPVQPLTLHLAFTGNPGTGKSSVARLVGEIYHEMGILSKGHTVEVGRSDLVGKFVGTTAPQTMELLESAKGGVFFLDEAYTLVNDSPEDYGQEAIDTILTFMENNRHDFVLIVAGYESPMLQFLQSNEGLLSRFGKDQIIHFDDYNPDELFEIFQCFCRETRHRITKEAAHEVQAYLTHLYNHRDVHFGNAREVRSYFENLQKKQAVRLSARGIDSATADDLRTFELADVRWRETTDEDALPKAMEKLNSLIGLSRVKKEVTDLVTLAKANKLRTQMGQPVRNFSLHLVFTGSPGTGKSTVAALMGDIYHALGLLPEGQMIRTSRNGLVAGFVGQTAKQTRRVIDTARGGVLFIDEAYTLTPDVMNDFGPEAVETIMDEMEVHRDDLVVIVAGYADRMEHFLDTNPGLRSRFNTYIHFDDYTPDELLQIFEAICQEDKMELSDLARQKLKEYFSKVDIATFGNARGVRNLYEKVLLKTYARGINDLSQGLSLIQAEDIPQT